MSRTVQIACDKCSTAINGGHSIIEVKHGDLLKQFDGPLDLCQSCSGGLPDLLRPPAPFMLESSPDGVGGELRAKG